MIHAITIGTVVKKALELLAVNDSGRKFLGYVLCIAVFLLLLPVIVVCGLFGWMANDGGTLLLRAEAIYLTCLIGREEDENFYNDLADCFLNADAETDVFDWITAVFGVEISEEDREMIEKIE